MGAFGAAIALSRVGGWSGHCGEVDWHSRTSGANSCHAVDGSGGFGGHRSRAAMEGNVLDERKLSVLRAIVVDYVNTREPVGSKALVERHQLGVSPATIRNDMAVLEEEGYIVAPHTSAGRVPTDKGYRYFVDQLTAFRPLSPSERQAIHTYLGGAVDLDDTVVRTVKLLSQLTHQVAVVQYPSLQRSSIRHVEVVGLGPGRLLVVVIADTGSVDQRLVELNSPLSEADVSEIKILINAACADVSFDAVRAATEGVAERVRPAAANAAAAVVAALVDAVGPRRDDRVLMAGTANLARAGEDFGSALEPVLAALEEQMVLLRLLGEETGSAPDLQAVSVRIGTENEVTGLAGASVVTTGYGSSHQVVAHLGVVGPTRMDYAATMGAVHAVARYLGRIIGDRI